jgi:predicted sulfurtransferase
VGIILLFYTYIAIEYPKRILKWQQKICTDLGLKGRIIIGHEGINGTVGGEATAIEHYKNIMHSHELFSTIDFKESEGNADDFPKLSIVVRDEIVSLGIAPKELTPEEGGLHLKPSDAHALMASKPDNLIILDARNRVEWKIGAFEGALKPNIDNFREFPAFIDKNAEIFKDKQVLMYCTGGIRCERASSYVKKHTSAQAVYQIEGGIHRYVEEYPDAFFRGKNYVFDNRIALRINADVLAQCALCATSCDNYTNCVSTTCNKHFICCTSCIASYTNTCGQTCRDQVMHKAVKVRTTPVRSRQSK